MEGKNRRAVRVRSLSRSRSLQARERERETEEEMEERTKKKYSGTPTQSHKKGKFLKSIRKHGVKRMHLKVRLLDHKKFRV
jgi:hypothetical protein